MKRGIVYCCDRRAGELVEDGGEYVFRYAPEGTTVLAGDFSHLAQKGGGVPGGASLSTACWPKARKRSGSAASCASTRTMPFRGFWPRVPTGRSEGCMWWRQGMGWRESDERRVTSDEMRSVRGADRKHKGKWEGKGAGHPYPDKGGW